MGCNVCLGDVVAIQRKQIQPRSGVIYEHYSMPAFDKGMIPDLVDGSDLLSGKLLVKDGLILLNKLNVKYRRIWPLVNCGPNPICSTEFVPLQPHDIDYWYLYYWLLLPETTSLLESLRTGTSSSHQRSDINAFLRTPLSLPSQETQQRIGQILHSLDDKIALNTRLNGCLEELLDVLFQSEILNASHDGWAAAHLTDIANYRNGLAMQRFRPAEGDVGLPVLKIRELRQGFCAEDAERCSSDIPDEVKIHDGDLVFSWSGSLLLDFWAGGDAGLNQHLFKVTSDTHEPWFYYVWTKHHMTRFISMAADRATTMGHIKRSALEEADVLIPPENRLEELATIFRPIVTAKVNNMVESKKLAALRDALLPKLISGEIDVSGIELS